MRKSVTAMLLVVVALFFIHYAAAEDLLPKYKEWLDEYDFKAVVNEIDSGKSGMSESCANDVLYDARFCADIMDDIDVEHDEATGELLVTHKLLKGAGKGCQIYPFIDDDGFKLFVGFPCKTAFVYDRIYLSCMDEMMKFSRSDFEIKAEMLNGKQWEYSILSFVPKDSLGMYSVHFRQDGSFSKEDYSLTDNESIASSAMSFIYTRKQKILDRIADFDSKGV